MTCWRRLRDWQNSGVWQCLHELLLMKLRSAGKLDFSRAIIDSSSVRALKRGTGPNPTDRAKPGSKHHLAVDASGTPLAASITGANRNDVTQLLPLIDALPQIRGGVGRPWHRPKWVVAGPGVRSSSVSSCLASAWHRRSDRSASDRPRQRPGSSALGDRTNDQLAAPVQTIASSLGASGPDA
jgi:hypothetical protein